MIQFSSVRPNLNVGIIVQDNSENQRSFYVKLYSNTDKNKAVSARLFCTDTATSIKIQNINGRIIITCPIIPNAYDNSSYMK